MIMTITICNNDNNDNSNNIIIIIIIIKIIIIIIIIFGVYFDLKIMGFKFMRQYFG